MTAPRRNVTREHGGSPSRLAEDSACLGYLRTGIHERVNRGSNWAGQLTALAALIASLAIVAFWVETSYEGVIFPLLLGALAAVGIACSAPGGSLELAEAAAAVGGVGGALYGLMPVIAQRSEGLSFAVLVIAGVMLATALACAVRTALSLPPDSAAREKGAAHSRASSCHSPLPAPLLAINLSPAVACLVIGAVEFTAVRTWGRAEGRGRRSAS